MTSQRMRRLIEACAKGNAEPRLTDDVPRWALEGGRRLEERTGWKVGWSADEAVECPWCHVSTPAPLLRLDDGRWIAVLPYPCECEGARRRRGELGEPGGRPAPRPNVPRRYADVVAGLTVDEYAAAVRDGTGLYFHGGPGTGKTATCYAICEALRAEGRRCVVTSVRRILDRMHDAFRSGMQQEAMEELTRCGALVLDDVGKEQSREAVSMLYRVVDERNLTGLPLVVTSNYSRGELGRALLQGGDAQTVRAIMSRLAEMTVPVYTGEDDRRLRHGA